MVTKSDWLGLGAFTLLTAISGSTLAAPAVPAQPATTIAQADGATSHGPRASLRLDLGKAKVWVGQAIPITLTALFRDVDGAARFQEPHHFELAAKARAVEADA